MLVAKHTEKTLACCFLKIFDLLFQPFLTVGLVGRFNDGICEDQTPWLVQYEWLELFASDLLEYLLVDEGARTDFLFVGHVSITDNIDMFIVLFEHVFERDASCDFALQLLKSTSHADCMLESTHV